MHINSINNDSNYPNFRAKCEINGNINGFSERLISNLKSTIEATGTNNDSVRLVFGTKKVTKSSGLFGKFRKQSLQSRTIGVMATVNGVWNDTVFRYSTKDPDFDEEKYIENSICGFLRSLQ